MNWICKVFLSVCYCISFLFLFLLCNYIWPSFNVLPCLHQHYSYLRSIKYCKLKSYVNKYIVGVVKLKLTGLLCYKFEETGWLTGGGGGEGGVRGTPCNSLYEVVPPERETFFRLQVYERVGISINHIKRLSARVFKLHVVVTWYPAFNSAIYRNKPIFLEQRGAYESKSNLSFGTLLFKALNHYLAKEIRPHILCFLLPL